MIDRATEILDCSFAAEKYGMLGHVGDGNFHIFLPVNDELYTKGGVISNPNVLGGSKKKLQSNQE